MRYPGSPRVGCDFQLVNRIGNLSPMLKKADTKDIEHMVVIKHDLSLPSCANNWDGEWQIILVEDRDGNHEAMA